MATKYERKGIVTFPDDGSERKYRFIVTAKDTLAISLEDIETKELWETGELAINDFVTFETVITLAKADNYAKRIAGCLEAASVTDSCTRSLSRPSSTDGCRVLCVGVPFQVDSVTSTLEYSFTLQPVELDTNAIVARWREAELLVDALTREKLAVQQKLEDTEKEIESRLAEATTDWQNRVEELTQQLHEANAKLESSSNARAATPRQQSPTRSMNHTERLLSLFDYGVFYDQLTDDDIAHSKEFFELFDTSKTIKTAQLGKATKALGDLSEAELKDLVDQLDPEHTGLIGGEQLSALLTGKMEKAIQAGARILVLFLGVFRVVELKSVDIFNLVDTDGKGSVSSNVLNHVMNGRREELNDDEVKLQDVMRRQTANLTNEEFAAILKQSDVAVGDQINYANLLRALSKANIDRMMSPST